jgi:hypothetical protein
MVPPRYPGIVIRLVSRNPLALVAAVRQELRRAGAGREEIERFSRQALASERQEDPIAVCRQWARIAPAPPAG